MSVTFFKNANDSVDPAKCAQLGAAIGSLVGTLIGTPFLAAAAGGLVGRFLGYVVKELGADNSNAPGVSAQTI